MSEEGRVVWKHIGLHGHSVGTFVADTGGIRWKSAATGNDDGDVSTSRTIPAKALKEAQWTVFGRSGHLRVLTNSTNTKSETNLKHELRFDGFPPTDLDKVRDTLHSLFQIELKKHTVSSTGTSWGLTHMEHNNLAFRQCILEDADEEGEEFEPREGNELLTLDLTEVSQCVLPGNNRNEIELQFPESDTVEAGTDQLVSIRFYVPPDPDSDPHDRETASSAENLQKEIMKTANIKITTGDVIASFSETQGTFLTPRGRYSIALYEYFFRMRGNKYDYKIKYDEISRLFLLPRPDEVHMAFVISLDKPIRQGQQRYQHLVLQLTKDPSELKVNLDEDTLQKDYNGDIQPLMTGALSNLVAKSFKVIARKKVFIPGKFANANQQACVKCALRASEGHLYPLEKQFIFIHKPTVLIRHDEVESVEFQRYAGGQGSTRNFDFCITLKASATVGSAQKEYIFSGIDRSDYTGLYNFLSTKKIRIKNLQADTFGEEPVERRVPVYNEDEIFGVAAPGEGGPGEESEDEDYDEEEEEAGGSESDDSDEDVDDDDLGSEVDDDMDSDLEEARAKVGVSTQKKKKGKKRPKEDSDEEETPKKKKKPAKDPNAPKRSLSAFMYFSTENRAQIKEANPDATFGEMGKIVAEQFKALSAEEKEKYDEKAAKDKKRYQDEMAEYEPPEEFSKGKRGKGTSPKKAKKKKKDPNEPKRPMTAFLLYSNLVRARVREENPDMSFGELGKLIGQKYKALGQEERAELDRKVTEAKEKYKEAMTAYKKKKAEEVEDDSDEDEAVVSDDSDEESDNSE